MKRAYSRLVSLFLCVQLLLPILATAQVSDNEIRVLAVTTNGVSTAEVLAQMNFLESFWPGSNGVVIDLANGGVPVPLGVTLTGSHTNQLNQATAHPLWNAYRTTWGADLMIVFTANIPGEDCGRAIQFNWTSIDDPFPGEYIGDPLNFNLDLRGSANGYAAIVQPSGGCPTLVAAHEMAHLLGSGHTKRYDPGKYLTDSSHAAAYIRGIPPKLGGGTLALKTIEAEGRNPPVCDDVPIQCQYLTVYSDGTFWHGADANTLATFQTTALSVANYFAGSGGGTGGGGGGGGELPQCNDGVDNDGDGAIDFPADSDCASLGDDDESDTGGGGGGGGCGLQAPANLVATLVGFCLPNPYSQYTLTWTDACPSATFNYQIHKAQPTTSGFVFGWQSFVPSTPAFINGAAALAKVRACDLFNCSGFSNTVQVVDGC